MTALSALCVKSELIPWSQSAQNCYTFPDEILKKGLVKPTSMTLDSGALQRQCAVSGPYAGENQSCRSKRSYGESWGRAGG